MKGDLDSIIVIIATLLFIIFTGLSRRRKKKPVLQSGMKNKQASDQLFKGKDLLSDAVTMINDPFAKLEKMFNIPEETDIPEGESLEVTKGMEQGTAEVIPTRRKILEEVPAEKEQQSLEVIVDEVAEYLKEKKNKRIDFKVQPEFDDKDLTSQKQQAGSIHAQKRKTGLPLFENVDEVRKAVIYAEILKNRDF